MKIKNTYAFINDDNGCWCFKILIIAIKEKTMHKHTAAVPKSLVASEVKI